MKDEKERLDHCDQPLFLLENPPHLSMPEGRGLAGVLKFNGQDRLKRQGG